MYIAVLGAGNGGQAIAGYLGMNGHKVNLYDRNLGRVQILNKDKVIRLNGEIYGNGRLNIVTNNLQTAIKNVDLVMVVTIANAHKEIARSIAPYIENDQIVVLNPGRTGGALEFKNILTQCNCSKRVFVAEAQTLIYACRITEVGYVNIIGEKENVLLASYPASDINYILNKISHIFPHFKPAKNVLQTSLENIGAIFHPAITLFNSAKIERGEKFYFYRDITPSVAQFIELFDREHIALGKMYGIKLLPVFEWISYAYPGTEGGTLCDRLKNNRAYYDITSPPSIYTRQLIEDIPTGILPMLEFARVAKLPMPIFESILNIASALLNVDFKTEGRTFKNMGLNNCNSIKDVIKSIQ